MKDKKSVLYITVDAVRRDLFEQYASSLMKWAKNSFYFSNAITPGPRTPYAFPGLLSSTPLLMFGDAKCLSYWSYCKGKRRLSPNRLLLSEFLKKKGYYTVGVNTNIYTSSYFGYNRGYDEFIETIDEKDLKKMDQLSKIADNPIKKIIKSFVESLPSFIYDLIKDIYELFVVSPTLPYAPGPVVAETIYKKVKALSADKKPFYLWAHFMDTHDPRLPPYKFCSLPKSKMLKINKKLIRYVGGKYKNPPSEEEIELGKKIYVGSIKFIDHVLSSLLNRLEDENLLEDVIVVITSDHGEAFMEHGILFHGGDHVDLSEERYKNFHKELLEVPLIFYDGENKGRIEHLTTTLDIPPTISKKIGFEKSELWFGEDLFTPKQFVVSEAFVRDHSLLSLTTAEKEKVIVDITEKRYIMFNSQDVEEKEPYQLSELPRRFEKMLDEYFQSKKNLLGIVHRRTLQDLLKYKKF